ncbi:MAG: zinc ribbon domain-containing protein [Dehalococcoidia bacterium]|nr:zinc ribbon domain-containing protein [Dehalococcoidia bacterium]
MNCSSCQRDNADGAAFCSGCGVPLRLVCPSCNRVNGPDAAFCSGCGQAPSLPSAP